MKKLIILSALIIGAIGITAHAAGRAEVKEIAIGSERGAVHERLGEPSKSGRLKEVYTLDDCTAIAHYDEETLTAGYILD